MSAPQRPVSPHTQIYRWYLTSVLSITHRISGVLLSLGTLILGLGLLAVASGPVVYEQFQTHLTTWYGLAGMLVWTVCLYYHLCNGIRHLFWDAGYGFDLRTANISAYVVLATTVVLTALTWLVPGAGAA